MDVWKSHFTAKEARITNQRDLIDRIPQISRLDWTKAQCRGANCQCRSVMNRPDLPVLVSRRFQTFPIGFFYV